MSKVIVLVSLFISTLAFATDPANNAAAQLAEEKRLGAEYLTKMATEKDATVIEQGVVLRPLFISGATQYPTVTDTVKVSYHLTDREGKLIEESLTSDEAIEFPLNRLIKCWQVAIPKMSVGSFYKISCPSDAAYGDKGAGTDIKPGAALTFRVILHSTKP